MSDLSVAYLLPTGRCNLHCEGCYATLETQGRKQKAGELRLEEYVAVIAELVAMGVRTFDISGGEPMLYDDIVALCTAIRAHADTRIWMVSNGTRFNEAQLEALAPLVTRLTISLDAPQATLHDRMRGKLGAFQRSMTAIRRARALPFEELAVNQLVCKKNAHTVADMIRLCDAERIDRLSVLTYRDVSENGVMPDQVPALAELRQTWDAIARTLTEVANPKTVDLVVPSFLQREVNEFRATLDREQRARIMVHYPHLRGLTAFRTTIVVKPLGGVTGDTAMVNDPLFDLGDLRQHGVRTLWEREGAAWRQRLAEREAALRAEGPCKTCPRWHHCRGGCPAAALHQSGTVLAHDRTCDDFRASEDF
ncbi:MAG: radical SAM protein [Kofleriaceae bacterium]